MPSKLAPIAVVIAFLPAYANAAPGVVVERAVMIETPPTDSVVTLVEGLGEWSALPRGASVFCEAGGMVPPTLFINTTKRGRHGVVEAPHGTLLVPELDESNAQGTCRLIDPEGTELRLHYEVQVVPERPDCKPFCSAEATLVVTES